MMICVLAEDARECWRAVFEPENLHIYVEFAPLDKADWMSIDDFLARIPRDNLHKQALKRLLERIARAFLS
ncbi:MAG: hypothetical protein EOS07_33935 [Mesorhizobium sp.]|nr:MAG: hypothetical protein EOS07_33935 [Mesorhizobium sp.]